MWQELLKKKEKDQPYNTYNICCRHTTIILTINSFQKNGKAIVKSQYEIIAYIFTTKFYDFDQNDIL